MLRRPAARRDSRTISVTMQSADLSNICCVESQPVNMELLNPICSIRNEEFTYRLRIRSVEVERFAPFIRVCRREVGVGELFHEVSVRAEMDVHHIENHAEAKRMRLVDKS